jgi:DNA-binding response OmpR family regulator
MDKATEPSFKLGTCPMNSATAPASSRTYSRPSSPLPVAPEPDTDEYVIQFSNVVVNLDRAMVTRGGKQLSLTAAEFELLTFFVQNPEKALTRDMILESVWSYLPSPNTRTVDAHVLRLRQKLEQSPDAPRFFVTVHKVGYRFSPSGA